MLEGLEELEELEALEVGLCAVGHFVVIQQHSCLWKLLEELEGLKVGRLCLHLWSCISIFGLIS